MYVSRHVVFNECSFPFSQNTPTSDDPSTYSSLGSPTLTILPSPPPFTLEHIPPVPPIQPAPTAAVEPNTPLPSTQPSPAPHPMTTRSKTNTLRPKQFPHHQLYNATKHPIALPDQDWEPSCYTQAAKSIHWRQAMASELDALAQNQTWTLVDPPADANIIDCKWLYRIKRKADGSIDRYKARLVAKGFNQQEGLDYFETFSPVVKPTTIRIVLSIALSNQWHIHQLDVNNAFLHGDLEETIYMAQPIGFIDPLYPHKVCLLRKALYGLKQAPRAWFHRLRTFLIAQNFFSSQADKHLFIFKDSTVTLFVLIYVDDLIITGNNSHAISALLAKLQSEFSIKDLGSLNYFLGVQVSSSDSSLFLTQTRYILSLLEKTHMDGAKPCKSPMATGLQLSKFSGTALSDPHQYRMTVGALQYLTITRPDISFSVNKLSQFMSAPTDIHWQSVKRVLRYLKGTLFHGIQLQRSDSLGLHAFTDADWAGCPDDRRSTTGYAIFLGKNLVSWSSKKQSTVARSSTEAEYRSMAMATSELIWIQSLLSELGIKLPNSPILWCDNLGATFLAANPVFHARTKHIELDFHFIREQIAAKRLTVQFLCSTDQLADILTKSLSTTRFADLAAKLTVSEDPLRLRGAVEQHSDAELDNSSSRANGQRDDK